MKLYAELPNVRSLQVARDIAAVGWIAVWIWVGIGVHGLVERLGAPGRTVEDAGRGIAANLESIASDIGGTPLVGDKLSAPFASAAQDARTLQEAGQAQQDVVHTLALWLGVLLAALPVLWLLHRYGGSRLRWVRDANDAARLRDSTADLRLFAYRAVARRPLRDLRRVTDDPIGDLERGDVEALARLELEGLGLRATPGARATGFG